MKSRSLGLSLTELLVSVALLSLVTAGGLMAFARTHAARADAGALQQLHERAQYVFATLEPELQMAGYFAASTPPSRLPPELIPQSATRCGVDLVARIDVAVERLPAWTLSCAPNAGGLRAGTQVLVVRRLSARLSAAAETGRAQWLWRAGTPGGQLFWAGDAPWTAGTSTHVAELRDLIVRVYYVAQRADGNPSIAALRVKNLTSIAGSPAFIDTEVMNGVEDLQVEVLPSASAPRAVRVSLRISPHAAWLPSGAEADSMVFTRFFSLRNAQG